MDFENFVKELPGELKFGLDLILMWHQTHSGFRHFFDLNSVLWKEVLNACVWDRSG